MQEPQVPPSDAIQFRTRARTRWSDEDNQNVLNNAVYLTLLEEARYDYFSALGLLEDHRFPFLLAQCHLRFLRPGRGARQLEVEVATTRLGKSSFEQAYRVVDLESGDAWLEAVALLVCYDPETGASRPMTAGFRRSVEACEGQAG